MAVRWLTCHRLLRCCGPGSRCSGRSPARNRPCVHCRSRVDTWGSPSGLADSGHTAVRMPPESRCTVPSTDRRRDPASPEGHNRTLGGRHKTQRPVRLVVQVHRTPQSTLDNTALTSAAVRPKIEGGRRARVAVSPDHIWPTLALATVRVTHGAERTLRVTLALWGTRAHTLGWI